MHDTAAAAAFFGDGCPATFAIGRAGQLRRIRARHRTVVVIRGADAFVPWAVRPFALLNPWIAPLFHTTLASGPAGWRRRRLQLQGRRLYLLPHLDHIFGGVVKRIQRWCSRGVRGVVLGTSGHRTASLLAPDI